MLVAQYYGVDSAATVLFMSFSALIRAELEIPKTYQ
jgi:hypothetical protein